MSCRIARYLLAFLAAFTTARAAIATEPLSIDLSHSIWQGDLDALIDHRAIRVLVPFNKTMYFVDYGGAQRGMSFEFMRAFEDELNAKLQRGDLRIHAVFLAVNRNHLIPLLLAGQGDVIAANLTVTPSRQREVDFIAPVASGVREIVVTGPTAAPVHALDDLSGREVFVEPTSSYRDSLETLNESFRRRHLPLMRLRNAPGSFETEDVLEMANAGMVGTVIADDYLARFWKGVYPNITLCPDVAVRESGDIAFAVRKNSPKLKTELDAFTRTHRVSTLFGNVELQKYLLQTRWARDAMSPSELAKFSTMVSLFRKYGDQYDVDWLLMAAQGYQESQLDQSRRSGAGAIGVMQVTPATGQQMGVGDIHDLEPNIHAGVKYVRHMVDTYYADPQLDRLNRVLFAIASYNAGPNRIRALRKEAAARQLNPDLWFDNVERVVAEHIGRETVQYVSNIYKYFIAYALVEDKLAAGLDKEQQAR